MNIETGRMMNDRQLREKIEQVLHNYCFVGYHSLATAIKDLIAIAKDYKRKKEK